MAPRSTSPRFFSGNQTAVVNEIFVPDGFDSAGPANGAPGGVPGPSTNVFGDPAPETGVIVRFENGTWKDSLDRTWNGTFPFNQGFEVPDNDVFAVNANTLVKGTIWNSVGNTIFGMAINPASNLLYVTTTESPNHIRFEGPGGGGSTVQGHLSESRVAILDPSDGSHTSNHLNLHIDYSKLHTDPNADHAAINSQIPHSLATPLLPAIHSSGSPVYIPAFGSSKIGVFTRAQLEDPSFSSNFDPTTASANYLSTQGGGPSGVIIDEVNNRLYVPTRFNNAVEVIDLNTGTTSAIHTLHNPEPQSIVEGRPFLYDATKTSGNGESSCHSCHIFNDFDGLNWNLGNPDEHMGINNIPQPDPILEIVQPRGPFHSMKGPMQVQTLRGLLNSGGMHWRGDRVDGFFGTDPCTSPGYAEANSTNAPCSEVLSFQNFIVAFEGLLGKEGTLTPLEMQKYTEFTLQVQLPPNPVRNLDNSLKTTPSNRSEQDGEDIWFSCGPGTAECAPLDPNATDTVEDCDGCHSLDPLNGFFGTGGEESFEGEPQHMKVPHNRNMYAKIGMFFDGVQQIRTSGFLHDGSVDTLKTFHNADLFDLSNNDEMALEAFLLAFDTDLSPITGQQVTIGPSNYSVADVNDRIDLINARAAAPFESEILGGLVTECGVVVKVLEGGREKGYARLADGTYQPDDNGPAITEAALRQKADPAGEAFTLTFTATPPGSEIRMGLDRDDDSLRNGVETMTGIFVDENDTGTSPFSADTDDDGFDDGIEVAHGSDPNNALSTPETPSLPGIGPNGRTARHTDSRRTGGRTPTAAANSLDDQDVTTQGKVARLCGLDRDHVRPRLQPVAVNLQLNTGPGARQGGRHGFQAATVHGCDHHISCLFSTRLVGHVEAENQRAGRGESVPLKPEPPAFRDPRHPTNHRLALRLRLHLHLDESRGLGHCRGSGRFAGTAREPDPQNEQAHHDRGDSDTGRILARACLHAALRHPYAGAKTIPRV